MRIVRTERVGQRIAVGIGVLVAAVLLANVFMALWTEGRLRSKIAAIRAAGDPASIVDLAPASIPADENGAAILAELALRLDAFGKEHGRFYDSALGKKYEDAQDRGQQATAEQIAAIREIVNRYSDLDAELAAAAACDKYASVADFSLDNQAFLDKSLNNQITQFRTALRFIGWRMEVLVADGKHEQAVEEGIASLQLARMYDHEPMIVNMLVACAVRGMAANSLYDALAAGPVSPALHAALDQELALNDDPQRMVHALKTERAFTIDCLMNLPSVGPRPPTWLFHAFGWPVKRYWIESVDYLNAEIASGGRPWFEAHQIVGRKANSQKPSKYGVLADLEMPAIQAGYDAEARTTAVLRALRIENALRQFAEKNGHEAAGLDELGLQKSATIDPFSGKPLKLKHTDDGWIIYSVMRNGVDDGGDFMELKDFGVAPKRHRMTSKDEKTSGDSEPSPDQ